MALMNQLIELSQQPYKLGAIIFMPILKISKLRHRERIDPQILLPVFPRDVSQYNCFS